ncbi:MAG: hypothetical protein EOO24_13985 [Comamonadaceae bacterium]|nr:MAG: hypothetical protein EOO24_13985 [Comamonadaceae bacterium]
MKHSSRIVLGLAASILALASQAGGIQATEVPRISNGGTGVIGGVEPGAWPRQASQPAASHGRMAHTSAPAAAASPNAMQAQAQGSLATRSMGAAQASPQGLAPRHMAWGTPD